MTILGQQSNFSVSGITLEGDHGSGLYSVNRFQVALRGISEISGYLRGIKVVDCVIEKGWKHGVIVGIWPTDLKRCHDVGIHAHIMCGLTQTLWILSLPCLESNQMICELLAILTALIFR